MMVTEGGSCYSDQYELSCTELLCGAATDNEPRINLVCFDVSKRVVKNMAMFVFVLLVYCFILGIITGK